MRSGFLRLWRRQRLLTLAFVFAVALAVAFTIRAVVFMAPFGAPPLDTPIEGWMTPRLVAHGWHLPPEVMAAALGLDPGAARGRTLEEIAEQQGRPVAELIARIEAAAAAWRAAHPPPAAGG
jgi:hypothetical protein